VSDVSFAAAFGGGMLSFVSPCVLPLVPGYLSLIPGISDPEPAGSGADPRSGTDEGAGTAPLPVPERAGGVATLERTEVQTRLHVLRATLLFVAGFTLVFTLLGLTATAVGQSLLDHRTILNRVAGALVIVMGLFLAGAITPRRLMADARFHVSPSKLGAFAPPVMGMAFAFGWTPCIGPILGGVLTLSANESSVGRGGLMLVAYSLGLGVPFVITGVALGRLTPVFAWVKRHFRVINTVAGAFLIVFGFLLFTNQLGWMSRQFSELLRTLHLESLTTI
jgi:cytochrome c-type biogenesis protein